MAVSVVYGRILPSYLGNYYCLIKLRLDSGTWGTPVLDWSVNDGFYGGIQSVGTSAAHFDKYTAPFVYSIDGADLYVTFVLDAYISDAANSADLYLEAGTISDGTHSNPEWRPNNGILFGNDIQSAGPVTISSVTLESDGRTVTIVYNNPGQAEDLAHTVPDGKGGSKAAPIFYFGAGWSGITVNTDDWDFTLKDEFDTVYSLDSSSLDYTVDGNDLIVTMTLTSGHLTSTPTLTINSDKTALYMAPDIYVATPKINDGDGVGLSVINNSTWLPPVVSGPANINCINGRGGFDDSISRIGIS